MLMLLFYPYIKFFIGTLYPAYKTWKSIKRKDETTRRRWLKYWVSYGAFQLFELVADFTLAYILPFYIELKLISILWLVMGSKLIFDSIVNRELTKREKTIDKWLTKLKKLRDELIASVWYEVSRCSVKIITTVFSAMIPIPLGSDESETISQSGADESLVSEHSAVHRPMETIMEID